MTSPPALAPIPSRTSRRNQDDAAAAARWNRKANAKRRKAQLLAAEAEADFRNRERMPRKRKLSACDQRIGGPNWRVTS
jgi:hypothetical protein